MRIKGARAQPLDPQSNRTALTKARLESFQTNGTPEMVVEAAECVLDKTQRVVNFVNSSDAMRAFTVDGKFFIEGVGFLWLHTNSFLIISNQVHTILHGDLIQSQSPKPGTTAPAAEPQTMEIFSDRFDCAIKAGVGVYTGRLRVTGTNQALTGGILTVKLPASGSVGPSRVESILIETNVVIDYLHQVGARKEAFHVTGETADYAPATDILHVQGHPTWRADKREGRADELFIDRTNKVFTGRGHGWLKMPGQSAGGQAFLARPGPAAARTSENRFVEVQADYYRFRTNLATFDGAVEVHDLLGDQAQGQMNCGRMTIAFSGTNELQQMIAAGNVVIQEGTNRLTGGRAVYTGTNGVLEMLDGPGWQAGPRRGAGDVVQVRPQKGEMFVRGNAWLRMPAEALSQVSLSGLASTNRAAPKPTTNQFADISCERYTLTQTNGHFQTGVHIRHPEMDWKCADLTVNWPHEGGRVDAMTAERSVVFETTEAKGQKTTGTGDKAVYTYAVTDGVTNEIFRLTGNPAAMDGTTLVGTNTMPFKFRNNVIVYDLGKHQVIATGSYKASSGATNAPGSNTSLLPKIAPAEGAPKRPAPKSAPPK
jgi:lipopolysaccharide export system protein LptA